MKTYTKDDIKIGWEPNKCTHSAKCAIGLSKVFKPKEKPWIKQENGSKQEIIEQVSKCPSGALTIIY